MIPNEEYLRAVYGNTPEMAFVLLESKYREKLQANLEGCDGSGAFDTHVTEYMQHAQAAADALGLDLFDFGRAPSYREGNVYKTYKDFISTVDQFKVQVQIKNARNILRYSVGLDVDQKNKLRNYVDQIKKVIDAATSLPTKKKERLFDLINTFLEEVDRDRAPWDRFADVFIGIAHLGGEAARELEPARKLIDSIARLLGRAKEFEHDAPQLPPGQQPRQIPGPPQELAASRDGGGMTDEVPF